MFIYMLSVLQSNQYIRVFNANSKRVINQSTSKCLLVFPTYCVYLWVNLTICCRYCHSINLFVNFTTYYPLRQAANVNFMRMVVSKQTYVMFICLFIYVCFKCVFDHTLSAFPNSQGFSMFITHLISRLCIDRSICVHLSMCLFRCFKAANESIFYRR